MKMKSTNSRKLRYGGITALLTALIIAIVIVFNVIFSALGHKLLWYIDLTPELLFTLSDNCIDLIEKGDKEFDNSSPIKMMDQFRAERRAENPDFKDEDLMINLIFCDDPDVWEENNYQRYVYETAKQLQDKFPEYIKVTNHNIIWNPSSVSKYEGVVSTSVIIECGGEYRVRSTSDFYIIDDGAQEPWAYNGEKMFASAILAVTRTDTPIACITTNHGESFSDSEFLVSLEVAGYKVQELNLAEDEIPENCRLMVVFNPKTDFIVNDGYSSDNADEIEKLETFLDGTNSMMVFLSPETDPLYNFEEYLEEWGIAFDRYETATDGNSEYHSYMVRDTSQSLTSDGYTIKGEYYTDGGFGTALTNELRVRSSTPPMMVFKNAMSISYSDLYSPQHGTDEKDESVSFDYATYSADGTYRSIYDVFVSSENAVAWANGMEVERATAYNPLKLMTISAESRTVTESNYTSVNQASYVIACGSTEFASQALLQSNAYGNSAFLEYALRTIGQEPVPVGVVPKLFADDTIDTVTTAEATQYTVVLTVVPAVPAIGAGIFVIVRRKNR